MIKFEEHPKLAKAVDLAGLAWRAGDANSNVNIALEVATRRINEAMYYRRQAINKVKKTEREPEKWQNTCEVMQENPTVAVAAPWAYTPPTTPGRESYPYEYLEYRPEVWQYTRPAVERESVPYDYRGNYSPYGDYEPYHPLLLPHIRAQRGAEDTSLARANYASVMQHLQDAVALPARPRRPEGHY